MESAAAVDFLPVVAAPSVSRDFLVVSIHDVAPKNREQIAELISELNSCGVRVCSLLVVPDYHREGLFNQDRQFVSWLRGLESQGHEIAIHGYFHERPSKPHETLRDQLTTRFYTQGEGEFYDIGYEDALDRIVRARDQFREAGLTPRGFVAPAWLLSPEGERAARDADLEYTTRLMSVLDLRMGKLFSARSLVYSVRNSWRRAASLAWNGAVLGFTRTDPLLRVSIHPPDRIYPTIWRQIIDSLRKMQRTRTPVTYRDWIAEQRTR